MNQRLKLKELKHGMIVQCAEQMNLYTVPYLYMLIYEDGIWYYADTDRKWKIEYSPIGDETIWYRSNLTIEMEREMKLKELFGERNLLD